VKDQDRPLRAGFRLTRGSVRLILLRFGVAVLTGLPALLAGASGLSAEAAQRPYYTEVSGRIPIVHFMRLMSDLPSGFVPAAIASVLLSVLADQLLTAGAIALFDPEKPADERPSVLSVVGREGLVHLYPFLRILAASALLFLIGAASIRSVVHALSLSGEVRGHSVAERMVILPLVGTLATGAWFSLVGAWVLWCRLFTVADGRRRVRRTALLALAVFGRAPLRGPVFAAALSFVAAILPGIVPVAWRLASPATSGAVFGWALAWALALLVQAFAWHALLRTGRLLLASPAFADLRARPDEPLGLVARLRGILRKRSAVRPPATAA
jgi:hypothetical protein